MATCTHTPPTLKRRKGETPEEADKRHQVEMTRWMKVGDLKDLEAEAKSLKTSVDIVEGLLKRARTAPAVPSLSPFQRKEHEHWIEELKWRLKALEYEIEDVQEHIKVLEKAIDEPEKGSGKGFRYDGL